MIRPRKNKDGSITHQVMFRDGTKQRSKSFETEKAAKAFEDKLRVLGVRRALAELEERPDGLTLDQLAEKFWTWKTARVRSDRTVHDYKRDYTNWIQPFLGHLHATTIDEEDVQRWVDHMGTTLSPKSVHDRHSILHGIFKFGSSPTRALIPVGHNPAVGTELPKKRKKPPKGFNPLEWQAIYAAMLQVDHAAADLIEFLVASQWRFSEAVALSTIAVEDDGTYCWVDMQRVARRQGDGSVKIVYDAKSEAGMRRIKIDRSASETLRRRVQAAEPHGLVFTTTQGSMWNYSHFYARFWKKAIAIANIGRDARPHMLRHTGVGLLALSGKVSPAEIQRRVGHQSITTTFDVYGGMIEDVSDDALDFMAAMRNAKPRELGGP